MTAKELNVSINRLNKAVLNAKRKADYLQIVETTIKPELLRLQRINPDFTYLNRKSILILLRLNLSFRCTPLHQFGSAINLEEL